MNLISAQFTLEQIQQIRYVLNLHRQKSEFREKNQINHIVEHLDHLLKHVEGIPVYQTSLEK